VSCQSDYVTRHRSYFPAEVSNFVWDALSDIT
jgi:hypothetical protein